ncbi:MAG: hypothetical protein ABR615_09100 [Pseudonocardiaceae bacterium]
MAIGDIGFRELVMQQLGLSPALVLNQHSGEQQGGRIDARDERRVDAKVAADASQRPLREVDRIDALVGDIAQGISEPAPG